jgi:hypothetical protein
MVPLELTVRKKVNIENIFEGTLFLAVFCRGTYENYIFEN